MWLLVTVVLLEVWLVGKPARGRFEGFLKEGYCTFAHVSNSRVARDFRRFPA